MKPQAISRRRRKTQIGILAGAGVLTTMLILFPPWVGGHVPPPMPQGYATPERAKSLRPEQFRKGMSMAEEVALTVAICSNEWYHANKRAGSDWPRGHAFILDPADGMLEVDVMRLALELTALVIACGVAEAVVGWWPSAPEGKREDAATQSNAKGA